VKKEFDGNSFGFVGSTSSTDAAAASFSNAALENGKKNSHF